MLIFGGGLFKTNTTAQVGMLYAAGDARRDSGYAIFYVGINLGAFLRPWFAAPWARKWVGPMASPPQVSA